MEGISIGYNGQWYVSLNLEVRRWDDVTGWYYSTCHTYEVDHDMTLLDEETLLGGKCLIQW
jgi:hypothetical protein